MPTPHDPDLDLLLDALQDVVDAEAGGDAEALRPSARRAAIEAFGLEAASRLRPTAPAPEAQEQASAENEPPAARRRLSLTTALRVAALLLVGLAIGLAFAPGPVTPVAAADVDLAYVAGRRWRRVAGDFDRRGSAMFVQPGTRIAWEPQGFLMGAHGLRLDVDPDVEVVARVDGREVGRASGGDTLALEDGWYRDREGKELELEFLRSDGSPTGWVGFRGVTFRWSDRQGGS